MPPDSECKSQREGGNPAALAIISIGLQHPEITPAELQAQRLRRLYAFTLSAANMVAELAYAAGVR
jgi:hypothetical protein